MDEIRIYTQWQLKHLSFLGGGLGIEVLYNGK
jgi:hypothetical protein